MSTDENILASKIREQEHEIQKLTLCNKTLSELYDNIRGIKHDFTNFVQALSGYVQLNDIEGIKTMVSSVTKECNQINGEELLYKDTIHNAALSSIISYKYCMAKKYGVDINFEILTDLEIKNFTYEVIRIISILLDNAIEAASKCKEKYVNLQIIPDYNYNKKIIIIENPYDNKEIDVKKIYECGFSSKINCGNEHGLGLWNVKQILKNNNNLRLYTTKDRVFRQQLDILMDEH